MTFVIGYWVIPAVVSAMLLLWAFLTPGEPAIGYFYIPDPMPIVRQVAAIIGSLIVWLIYFMVLALKK